MGIKIEVQMSEIESRVGAGTVSYIYVLVNFEKEPKAVQ